MNDQSISKSNMAMVDGRYLEQRFESESDREESRGGGSVLQLKGNPLLVIFISKRNRAPSSAEKYSESRKRMESTSKPSLTPKERIELIRVELESIKVSTTQRKWEMLNMEMQDIKDDLLDEIHTGLKDAANLMGDLGKRLSKLELQVEELTKALGNISEATAEASSKIG
jgi:hypothetical protein